MSGPGLCLYWAWGALLFQVAMRRCAIITTRMLTTIWKQVYHHCYVAYEEDMVDEDRLAVDSLNVHK